MPGETGKQRKRRIRKRLRQERDDPFKGSDEAKEREIYAGTLNKPDTSPRWKKAAVMFSRDNRQAHPNDDNTREEIELFYGYSKSRKEYYETMHEFLREAMVNKSQEAWEEVRNLAQYLPELIVDKGCEVLSLVGYCKNVLVPPYGVQAYVRSQAENLTAVTTGVPQRQDIYAAVSVLLVGDASLTETLVVHTCAHIVENHGSASDWAVKMGCDANEPQFAILDAVSPESMKYISPVTLKALADVLGCPITCLAGAPTIAQTDPQCRHLRKCFGTSTELEKAEQDARPSELAIAAIYDHEADVAEESRRRVRLPFKCYGLVPDAYKTLINSNLLQTKRFAPENRGKFPEFVLANQLREETRMLQTIGAGGVIPGGYQQGSTARSLQGNTGGKGKKKQGQGIEDKGGGGRRGGNKDGVAEEEREEDYEDVEGGEEDAAEENNESFNVPYEYNPRWKKDGFYTAAKVRDLFLKFMAAGREGLMEDEVTNPMPGGLYFCKRTKSTAGVDELPGNLGPWTTESGKGSRQTRTKYVERNGGMATWWAGKQPPHLPVETYRNYVAGDASAFTEEETKERFYKVLEHYAYTITKSGEKLKIKAWA